MKLLMVRHGESTWNVEGRYQGRKDPPLSPLGEKQAVALAGYLAIAGPDERPITIVSSPLVRARRTAEIVGASLGIRVDVDDRLIEISHGEWEGLLKREIEQRWPDMMAAWRHAPETVRFPGGESLADVKARWLSCLQASAQLRSPLLIVTHDVIVRLAVLDARSQSLSAFGTLTAENAALTEIERNEPDIRLVRFNERSYLGPLRSDAAAQAL